MRYLGIVVFLFLSCGPEAFMFKKTFVIKNSTNVSIVIKVSFNDELNKQIELSPNTIFVGDEIERTSDLNNFPNDASVSSSIGGGNEVLVIFNNERTALSTYSEIDNGLGFFSEPVERNLLRNGNYVSIGNNQSQFTITQQDFDNATPCDGPCE